jgi:predicted DNA-binding WGR domain protein
MSDKRMFEHADENKFWEIWAEGPKIFTRHGKVGSNGQTKIKDGDSTVFEKMIKEKVGAGYTQTGGEVSSGPELDKKELKRHLGNIKSLDDGGAISVLADWLQTQNHPWGELIALQHGAATNPKKAASLGKQADKHLKENGPVILGGANDKRSHFDWHHGFVRRAVVATHADAQTIAKTVKSFLGSPVSHLLETLVIAPYPVAFATYRDWGQSTNNLIDPWKDLDKLAKLVPDRITRVGFGGWPAMVAAGYVHMPSFAKLSAAFPKLTALELTGWVGDKPGKLSLPQLLELSVRFARGTSESVKAIATSKLPKLQRLSVWLGGSSHGLVDECFPPDDYDEDDEDGLRYPETYDADDLEDMGGEDVDCDVGADDLKLLLDANFGPNLTHLEIGAPSWTPDLMTALVRGKLLAKLKTLSITGGYLDTDRIKPLVAAAKSLSKLDSIEIRSRMQPDVIKKLSPLKNAKVIAVEEPEEFHFRYVATME